MNEDVKIQIVWEEHKAILRGNLEDKTREMEKPSG